MQGNLYIGVSIVVTKPIRIPNIPLPRPITSGWSLLKRVVGFATAVVYSAFCGSLSGSVRRAGVAAG